MIRVANAPCSWGAFEFEEISGAPPWRKVLSEMRESGYEGTELGDWGFLPTDPSALSDALSEFDLSLLGAFVPVEFANSESHGAGVQAALRVAHLVSAVAPTAKLILADESGRIPERVKNAGRITPAMGLSTEGWKTYAKGVELVAKAVREETGLPVVFHHHCAGYVETPEEVRRLLDLTDPALVGLCLDAGHYRFGGGDPTEALREFGDRIEHIHFKDCSGDILAEVPKRGWDYFEAVRQGVFCRLGEGTVDFGALLAWVKSKDFGKSDPWVVVEQDVFPGFGDPLENAQHSRTYLKGLGI